jgi:hypothetical protein
MVRKLPNLFPLIVPIPPERKMREISIFDRLVEDQNFYVKVQKTKLAICIIGLSIIGIWNRELLLEIFFWN